MPTEAFYAAVAEVLNTHPYAGQCVSSPLTERQRVGELGVAVLAEDRRLRAEGLLRDHRPSMLRRPMTSPPLTFRARRVLCEKRSVPLHVAAVPGAVSLLPQASQT